MRRVALVVGIVALGLAASTAARADFAVVHFHDGHCTVWSDSKAHPVGEKGWKYHWLHLKSAEMAESKKHYALKHHWCKYFD